MKYVDGLMLDKKPTEVKIKHPMHKAWDFLWGSVIALVYFICFCIGMALLFYYLLMGFIMAWTMLTVSSTM